MASAWRFALVTLVLVVAACFVVPPAQAQDSNLMGLLYDKILDLVVPDNRNGGPLTQVLLFEGGGLTINREDFDEAVWARNSFRGRMPAALEADLVDRIPRFSGTTFADSGARVSTVWGHLMRQYVVPVYDNPVVNRQVKEARNLLANNTLDNVFFAAIDQYQAEADNMLARRDECLLVKAPSLCAQSAVVWNERRVRRWFTMEVAKRELLAAQSQVLALQGNDMRALFANALEKYSSSEKADVGAANFGSTFYDTNLTPSRWWAWWPLDTSRYNYNIDTSAASANASLPAPALFISLGSGFAAAPTIVLAPGHGSAVTLFSSGIANITYTPTLGYTGSDTIGYTRPDGTISYISIAVTGSDSVAPNPAFATVTVSSAEATASVSSSAYGRVQTSGAEYNSGIVSVSGSFGSSTFVQQSSFSSSTSLTTMQFEFAKVSVARRWLDTSLLSFYPVAISGLAKNTWSDGLVQVDNPRNNIVHTFKLLPTAFLVARNIRITSTSWGSTRDAISGSTATGSSGRVSIGPFSAGSSSASGSAGGSVQASSSFNGNTLTIRGPQILGWLCTPMPAFPTASIEEVEDYARKRSIPATPPPTVVPANATVVAAAA